MTRLTKVMLLMTMTLGMLFTPSAFSQTNPKMEKAITKLKADDGSFLTVEEAMLQYGLTGLSVVVFENYEIAWTNTWGYKAVGTKDKIDPQTAFSTASISKAITGTLFVMLAEEGLIDLDKPVNIYLKRWKLPENDFTKAVPVTLRHLLSHTAGTTQHGFADFYKGDNIPSILESVQGKLPRYDRPIEVDFEPGTQWRYSGGGYTIAQMALEDQLGKSLAELAEEFLFQPLGIKHTTMFQDGAPQFLTNVAKVHNEAGEVIKTGIPICPQTAASAMWSTPTDMALFLIEMQRALAGKPTEVISTEVAQKVTEIQTTKGLGGWSMGWARYHRFGNREWFSHGGSNTGTGGHIYATMEDGHGIAFFGNGPNGIRMPILDKLRSSIIEAHGWSLPNPYADQALKVDQAAREAMTGLYFTPFQEFISIQYQDEQLFVPEFGIQPEEQLFRVNENTYAVDERSLFFQYRKGTRPGGSVEMTILAVLPELQADEPNFVFVKIAQDPIQPATLLEQGKVDQVKALFTRLPLAADAKERFINSQGYQFLRNEEVAAAIAVFQINVELFPKSYNVYDSLGEAYLAQGDKEKARHNYEKSLELNPENENAKRVLAEEF